MKSVKNDLAQFYLRAKALLEKRKNPGLDAPIYSDLSEAFALLSNGVDGLGMEHARKVAAALRDPELSALVAGPAPLRDYNVHADDMAENGIKAEWLSDPEAEKAYDDVAPYSSAEAYGLDKQRVGDIERIDLETDKNSEAVVDKWLAARIGATKGSVLIIYGRHKVCEMDIQEFLAHHSHVFAPSRDDSIVVPKSGDWLLFFDHENEYEFGIKKSFLP